MSELRVKYLIPSYVVIVFLAVFTIVEFSCAVQQSQTEEKLNSLLEEFFMNRDNVLGAVVRLNIQDKGSFGAAYGFTDITKNNRMQKDDNFAIGSITKLFTSVLVHQLIEEGKINPNDHIINYLPDDWAGVLKEIKYGSKITVLQALTHRSGIFDSITLRSFLMNLIENPSKQWNPLELIEMVRDEGKPYFKPDESFKYSSTNYLLLGALIENVTKKSYANIIKKNIFSKVGMENSFVSDENSRSDSKITAKGYIKIRDRIFAISDFDFSWGWSAGEIVSNAEDLADFMTFLSESRLFKKSETFQNMINLPDDTSEYRKGIKVYRSNANGTYYGHAGYFGGTSASVNYFPQKKTSVSACINYYNGDVKKVWAIQLINHIVKEFAK